MVIDQVNIMPSNEDWVSFVRQHQAMTEAILQSIESLNRALDEVRCSDSHRAAINMIYVYRSCALAQRPTPRARHLPRKQTTLLTLKL